MLKEEAKNSTLQANANIVSSAAPSQLLLPFLGRLAKTSSRTYLPDMSACQKSEPNLWGDIWSDTS